VVALSLTKEVCHSPRSGFLEMHRSFSLLLFMWSCTTRVRILYIVVVGDALSHKIYNHFDHFKVKELGLESEGIECFGPMCNIPFSSCNEGKNWTNY
jgi:hypothetical protein